MTPRLALGTVQFGMAYGIANSTGRPSVQTVADILARARAGGIDMLDTAIAYGDAETVLGRIGLADWQVVTKLPSVPEDITDIAGWMEAQVTGSLSRLGFTRLHGLLLHDPEQMHGARAGMIARALNGMAAQGLVERIGVSIQRPDRDLPAVLEHMEPSLIQSPFNLLDDSLARSGWAARLQALGCEIHTRSSFLQGLLLMPASCRPVWCERFAEYWKVWDHWLVRRGLSAPAACMRFVRASPDIDFIVLGMDSVTQLDELLATGASPLPDLPSWPRPVDDDLITPSRWPVI
jgi:aryl-alcohol dehydrogenase-like predicted oxidoreductase